MQPKVSVIIAVYNGIQTLPKAVSSVLSQRYKEIELIIIDGNSTDGTVDYLKSLQAPNLIWTSEADKGVYDAMNKGIQRATGDWIYFLGSDDSFIASTVLEQLFSKNIQDNIDLLYGNVLKNGRKYDGEFNNEKLLQRNICHQAIFYKKNIIQKIGAYQIEFKIFADWDYNLKCFFDEKIKVQYVDIVIAHFEIGGISSGKDDYAFFRKSLFPFALLQLNNEGNRTLRNIARYDRWWRLLRSMKLKNNDGVENYNINHKIPPAIQALYRFQQKIPYRFLQNGFISKAAMSLSYFHNRFIKGNFK